MVVHPDGAPFVKKILATRRLRLERAGKFEDSLFPPLKNKGECIAAKDMRVFWEGCVRNNGAIEGKNPQTIELF